MKYWKPGDKGRIVTDTIRQLKPGKTLNESALYEYVKYQYYTGEETLFKGIARERPQALAEFTLDYQDIEPDEAVVAVEAAIRKSVSEKVILAIRSLGDAGFMVSGGIDSSIVTAMGVSVLSQREDAFTGCFLYDGYNEVDYVKSLAGPKLRLNFVPIVPQDFVDNIEKVILNLEEPCGGPGSFSQWMVYKAAAEHSMTTLFTGEGGDEFFLGYDRYLDFSTYPDKVWRYNLPIYDLPIDINERPPKPESFDDIMLSEVRHDLPALLAVDEKLPRAFGIETIAPMICDEVIALAQQIPPEIKFRDGQLKWVLKQIAKKWLPPKIANRQNKMGFPTPFVKWLKEDTPVRSFFLDTMNSQAVKERGIYKADWEKSIEQEHEYGRTLWGALSLELWFKLYMD